MRAPIFPPGSTIGVMGSGQLGRMLALAARRMGYKIRIFSPYWQTPAGEVADLEVTGNYDDERAVRGFAREVDVLTFEFENISAEAIHWAEDHCVVRPSGNVLEICQHRLREKLFLRGRGFPLPEFAAINSDAELEPAAAQTGFPAVLKTAAFGYDGKGQRKVTGRIGEEGLEEAWGSFLGRPAVLERWVPFAKEISVIVARGADGAMRAFSVCENSHARHILDVTLAPARIEAGVARHATELALGIAEALELVGVVAVEMFLLEDGTLLVNELAPRPHNSGHFSIEGAVTSQFEQQVRAVCGLPLGSPDLLHPAAMANLLGDLWSAGEPDWAAALAFPEVKLHLYGKVEAKPGRKMGHLVALGADAESAAGMVTAARDALLRQRRR